MNNEEQQTIEEKDKIAKDNFDNRRKKPKQEGPSYIWIYLALILIIGFTFFSNYFQDADSREISRIQFDRLYKKGQIDHLETINEQKALVFIKKDSLGNEEYKKLKIPATLMGEPQPIYFFRIYSNAALEAHVSKLKAQFQLEEINIVPKVESNGWMSIGSTIFTTVLFLGLWYLMMRKMSGGGGGGFPGGGIFSIGKSKATLFDENGENQITFKQVAGLDEAKQEVMEIVDFLKDPKKYTNLGGKIPKGALLIGPPGTGKTLLAKAMAGEAKVPFFSLSGSDFVEMFVGVGASRVRDLFKQAREKSPCIIFIDEIDAIGRARGKSMMGGNDERENTLNQLLVEMDGFGTDSGIIIIAATNRPDVLDDALLRPGRFDRQISIDRPDLNGREQIFKVHLKKIKIHNDISTRKLASQTPGFAGADIANVCNEAALIAARKNKEHVEMEDFIAAIDRVIGGLEKKNKIILPEEKEVIAYHEAGHAICGWFLEHAHPLVKVTIVPRGVAALGYAQYQPREKYINTKEELLDDICMTLGGRAAEKLVFNKISTGAYSDLEQTTQRIYAMVVAYGMSDKVGHVNYHKMIENSYQTPYSNDTAKLIDEEIRSIADTEFHRAMALLTEKREELERLAKMLLEKEVLQKDDLIEMFGKRPWDKEEAPEDSYSNDENTSNKESEKPNDADSSEMKKEEISQPETESTSDDNIQS
jgi:cell division protease FtsH